MFDPYYRSLFAETLLLAGQPTEALAQVQRGLDSAAQSGNCYWNAQLLKQQGDCLRTSSYFPGAAEESYHQAMATARQCGAKSLDLRAAISITQLWQQQKQRSEAYQLLAPIYHSFTQGLDSADLVEARALLN